MDKKSAIGSDASTAFSGFDLAQALFIAGLGFFVDVYDIVLFLVVRIPSLSSIGVASSDLMAKGLLLLNMQMAGMMVGGVLWGILGDKKGRKSVLFGSILLYSIATLLNGLVHSVPGYAILRFLAGVGLAGEVGAAMTIAAEVTPKKYRGYGTAAVAGLGVAGELLASYVGGVLPWRMAFITAGVGGLVLLLARMSLKETALFEKAAKNLSVQRGNLGLFLKDKKRIWRLLRCVMAAVPLWFALGILVPFAPEIIGNKSNIAVNVAAIVLSYAIGETSGEVVSGVVSQLVHSRRLALFLFLFGAFCSLIALLKGPPQMYAIFCFPLGFSVGSWSVVVTTAAEQFGTNLRSTATTLVPNLVRGSTIPLSLIFGFLATTFGASNAAMITGCLCILCAGLSIAFMDETFGKDLDFIES